MGDNMRSIKIIAVFIVVVMVFCFAPLNIVSSVDINSSTEDRSEYIYILIMTIQNL